MAPMRFIDLLPTPVTLLDPTGRSVAVNPAYVDLMGLPADVLCRRTLDEAVHPDDVARVRRILEAGFPVGVAVEEVVGMRHGDGTWRRVGWTMLRDEPGGPIRVVATDLRRPVVGGSGAERKSDLDHVTMVLTREGLRRRVEDALLSRRDGELVGLVHVVVGGVNLVNDGLGRRTGDELLAALARRLERLAGPGATAARIVGAEFAVLFPRLGALDELERLARRIQDTLNERVRVLGHSLHVTATLGAAAVEEGTADDLLERAEVAADRAVESGTGTILVYDDAFRDAARRFITVLDELRDAVELGSFVPHYQALVELPHGGHIGAEVLARWVDGDDIRPAGTWIDVARRGRLLAEISEAVRRRALAEAARAWPRCASTDGPTCRLSVNIDGDELLAEGFVERLRAELAAAGLEPHPLMVEITEQALLTDLARAAAVVRSLREAGIRVALDDFGTGWSSLGYLRELDVDLVKLDRSFLQAARHDDRSARLFTSIVDLLHGLGVPVLAEGVETDLDETLVVAAGCDFAQGFRFGRPRPWVDPH